MLRDFFFTITNISKPKPTIDERIAALEMQLERMYIDLKILKQERDQEKRSTATKTESADGKIKRKGFTKDIMAEVTNNYKGEQGTVGEWDHRIFDFFYSLYFSCVKNNIFLG